MSQSSSKATENDSEAGNSSTGKSGSPIENRSAAPGVPAVRRVMQTEEYVQSDNKATANSSEAENSSAGTNASAMENRSATPGVPALRRVMQTEEYVQPDNKATANSSEAENSSAGTNASAMENRSAASGVPALRRVTQREGYGRPDTEEAANDSDAGTSSYAEQNRDVPMRSRHLQRARSPPMQVFLTVAHGKDGYTFQPLQSSRGLPPSHMPVKRVVIDGSVKLTGKMAVEEFLTSSMTCNPEERVHVVPFPIYDPTTAIQDTATTATVTTEQAGGKRKNGNGQSGRSRKKIRDFPQFPRDESPDLTLNIVNSSTPSLIALVIDPSEFDTVLNEFLIPVCGYDPSKLERDRKRKEQYKRILELQQAEESSSGDDTDDYEDDDEDDEDDEE